MLTPASKPTTGKARLAYFEELTSFPIVAGIEGVVKSVPVRRATLPELRDIIVRDEAEVALMPAVDMLTTDKFGLLPASCVSAMGPSRIFFLVSKVLPSEIHRVFVDSVDYGGTQLAQLLFPKKLMTRPEFVQSPFPLDPTKYNMQSDDGYDAYLLVGRHGFMVRKDQFAWTWDLTQAWYDYANLPFVMHVWAARKEIRLTTLEKELGDTARRNEASMEELSIRTAERVGVVQSGVSALYGRALFTQFDHQTITSLRRFGQELQQNRVMQIHPITLHSAGTATAARR